MECYVSIICILEHNYLPQHRETRHRVNLNESLKPSATFIANLFEFTHKHTHTRSLQKQTKRPQLQKNWLRIHFITTECVIYYPINCPVKSEKTCFLLYSDTKIIWTLLPHLKHMNIIALCNEISCQVALILKKHNIFDNFTH